MADLRLVALDLSLTGTGIAHTHNHKGEPAIGCRTVHTGTQRGHERLHNILTDVAAASRSNPHLAVVEGLYVGQKNNTLALAELRGVILHWLWNKAIPYVEVPPATLKIWATGNGAADKTAVYEAVLATYGQLCHIEDHNASDAMALLSMAAHAYSAPLVQVLDPRKLRAANGIKWPDLAAGRAELERRGAGGA